MTVLFAAALWTQVLCATDDGSCEAPPVLDDPAPTEVVPADSCDLPICGPLGDRLYCIERYESGHSGTAYNRRSGASGWLQWLPATAAQWGVIIGNRWSEWHAAARVAAQGERFFRSQWVSLQLGLC